MILADHEYHGVEYDNILPGTIAEMIDWLTTRHGVGDGTVWFCRGNGIYFANETDHLMFLMVWESE